MLDYTPAQQEYLNELSLSCPAHDAALAIIGRLEAERDRLMERVAVYERIRNGSKEPWPELAQEKGGQG